MTEHHDDVIKTLHQKLEEANLTSTSNRARSITVGTCFNGISEIMMRGNNGAVLWCPMQQEEIVELISQLAASVGCNIKLEPRDDFASWRNWRSAPPKP